MSPIVQGLIITGIGMGLVFLAILLLWGLMTLLVRWTSDKPEAPAVQEVVSEMPAEVALPDTETKSDKARLHKAAAAAVAIALQLHQRTGQLKPQESSAISPWQATRRATFLGQSANLQKRRS